MIFVFLVTLWDKKSDKFPTKTQSTQRKTIEILVLLNFNFNKIVRQKSVIL